MTGIFFEFVVSLEPPGRFPAVHHRHTQIHQNQIRALARAHSQRLCAIFRDHHVVVLFQQLHDQVAVRFSVIDDQYLFLLPLEAPLD